MGLINKRKVSFFLTLLFFVGLNTSFSFDQKWEKEFSDLDKYADKGDYRAGLFYVKKIEKDIAKEETKTSPEYLFLETYRLFFTEKFDDGKTTQKLIRAWDGKYNSQKDKPKESIFRSEKLYLRTLLNIGLYAKADSMLQIFKAVGGFDKETQAEYDYKQAYILYKKGSVLKAEKICDKEIEILKSALSSEDKKISHDQGVLYNHFLLLKAHILADSKKYKEVEQLLLTDKDAVFKILSTERGELSLFQYERALAAFQRGDFSQSETLCKKAYGLATSHYLLHAPEPTKIAYLLEETLREQGKVEEANFYNNKTDVYIIGYYGRSNRAYLLNSIQDIIQNENIDEWDQAKAKLEGLLTNSALPFGHEYREMFLLEYFNVLLNVNDFEHALEVNSKIIKLQNELYGSDATVLEISKIRQLELLTYYKDEFKEGQTILAGIDKKVLGEELGRTNSDYARLIFVEGQLYTNQDLIKKAKEIYKEELSEIKSILGENSLLEARYLTKLAYLSFGEGDIKLAEKDLAEVKAIFNVNESFNHHNYEVDALALMASIALASGEYSKGDSLYSVASMMTDNTKGYLENPSWFLDQKAVYYIQNSHYSKAERFLSETLVKKERLFGEEHSQLCITLCLLGELNMVSGNYEEAYDFIDRAVIIAEKAFGTKNSNYTKVTLYEKQLAMLFGDAQKCADLLKEAIIINSNVYGSKNVLVGELTCEYVLVQAWADSKKKVKTDFDVLDEKLLNALSIIKVGHGNTSPSYAKAQENAAHYYLIKSDYKLALEATDIAINIWNEKLGEGNLNAARLEMLRGKIFQRTKSFERAITSYEIAKNSYKKNFDKSHPGYIQALGKAAQVYYIQTKNQKAISYIEECLELSMDYIEKVFPLLSERGKAAFWEQNKEHFELYKTIAFTYADKYPNMVGEVFNIELQTRAILLNSTKKVKAKILSSGDEGLISLFNQLQSTREDLSLAYSLSPKRRNELGYDISKLESNKDRIEKELSTKSEYFNKKKRDEEINWKNLKKQLNPGEAVVEIVPFEYLNSDFKDSVWYAVLLLDANTGKNPSYSLIKDGNFLQNEAISYYRNCMKLNLDDQYSNKFFWQPIAQLLEKDYSTIYVVNDGVYNQINLETIKDNNGDYLLMSQNIINISTSRDIFERVKTKSKEPSSIVDNGMIQIFGNPNYYENNTSNYNKRQKISQLPGAEDEVKLIDSLFVQKQWQSNLFTFNLATEDLVKNIHDVNILHISTHGFFLDESKLEEDDELSGVVVTNSLLKSGLLFKNAGDILANKNINYINHKDGVLTAYEAMNLSLDNTDLVVLSACETGLGEVVIGEGVYGLQRSLFVAGAETLIMSLFKVPDESTKELMTAFYDNLLIHKNKHKAFIEAKKSLMQQYEDPMTWGAFVMIGME